MFIWLNGGANILALYNFNYKAELDVRYNEYIFTASYYNAAVGSILSTTQDREFYSLQAGVTKVYGVFVLSGSVGPSYNRFVDYTITSGAFLYSSYVVQPPVYNAGVAFKVQAILCAQFAGFGFSFDGNFNGKSSFIGGTLSVSLGWMRRSRFIDLPLKHGG